MSAAITYTLELDNYQELADLFKRAPANVAAEAHKAVQKGILVIESMVKREAPVSKGSGGGTLRQSIRSHMTGPAAGIVEAGTRYAGYVEGGTPPHDIRPKTKRVLASRITGTRSGGQYQFFGTLVHHPGTQANPFFKRGLDKSKPQINSFFGQAIANALRP